MEISVLNLGRVGWVVQKLVNANPGSKVNQSIKINISHIKIQYLCLSSKRLFKFKTEVQTK